MEGLGVSSFWKCRNVLVTGGFGYLGGRIVAMLSTRVGVGIRALAHGRQPVPRDFPQAVEIRRGDVQQAETLRGLCDGVTHVVHLAGLDQATCENSPADGTTVSGLGTLYLATEAAAAGVRRFLFISSVHVYGAVGTDRVVEDTPLRPVNPYGVSRAVGELFARMVGYQRGLSVAVLRLSNGYGAPGFRGTQAWSLVVNDLCRQAVKRGEIVLRGSGMQRRDFVAVTDVVAGVEQFLALPDTALGDGTFNLGSGKILTVLDVAECVREEWAAISGMQVRLRTGVDAVPEPPMPQFDIGRALALGYTPQTDPREEIRRTLEAAAGPFAEEVS